MQVFHKLNVWAKAHALVLDIYRISQSFPHSELYGLTSQLRRSAVSIPANIAEGCGRDGNAELARFLHISMGSASEVEYHLLLAHDLGFIAGSDFPPLADQVQAVKRMLAALIRTVRDADDSPKSN